MALIQIIISLSLIATAVVDAYGGRAAMVPVRRTKAVAMPRMMVPSRMMAPSRMGMAQPSMMGQSGFGFGWGDFGGLGDICDLNPLHQCCGDLGLGAMTDLSLCEFGGDFSDFMGLSTGFSGMNPGFGGINPGFGMTPGVSGMMPGPVAMRPMRMLGAAPKYSGFAAMRPVRMANPSGFAWC